MNFSEKALPIGILGILTVGAIVLFNNSNTIEQTCAVAALIGHPILCLLKK